MPNTKETIQLSARQKHVHVHPDGQWKLLFTACCPQLRDVLHSWEKRFIIVVVSPLAVLMKDQVIAVVQRIVSAAYVGDAKKDAEVAKDKQRKF